MFLNSFYYPSGHGLLAKEYAPHKVSLPFGTEIIPTIRSEQYFLFVIAEQLPFQVLIMLIAYAAKATDEPKY